MDDVKVKDRHRPTASAVRRAAQRAMAPVPEQHSLRRRRDGRLIAGVAGGVAEHLGIPLLWVRVAFVLLAAFGGSGVLAYAMLWVFVPQRPEGEEERPASARERQQGYGLVLLGAGLMVAVGSLISLPQWVTLPMVVGLVGAAVVWREADESQRRRWRAGARSGLLESGWKSPVRLLAGAALVVLGIVLFLVTAAWESQVQFVLLAVLATLVGAAVLTVPWWVRLVRDLNVERADRIRSEERAEIAAHLHDSVLQTLALIQKQAESPREVQRLARGQERELRGWLYGADGYGGGRQQTVAPSVLSAELARICGEVEDGFAIQVQQVAVGDCDLDERLAALLAAAREAIVNAAKHAGVGEVSVYAEVEGEAVSVYVRDRGRGFDPEQVPDDRHGLADSVRGRVERHGGEVRLRTAPGSGTEVQMRMPRADAA
ncbi:PspC domain-containing protein [Saccharopolyspora cebuensis]